MTTILIKPVGEDGVCLVMLARDEEQRIGRALKSAAPLVDDMLVIDTGSKDDTVAEAKAAGADVIRRPWHGFAHNRTEALHLARGRASYLLMLDADHEVTVTGQRPELDADAYLLPVRSGGTTWRLPLLTKSSHPFEYRGVAHAHLASDAPTRREPSDWITIDGGKGASREKLERDVEALTAAFADDPTDARTVFYLARTHDDLDHVQEAIQWYRVRAAMDGWAEEVYYSRYRLGVLLGEHVAFADAVPVLYEAWQDAPHRAEALRALGNLAHAVADKTPQPADGLFVHHGAYKKEAA